PTSTTSRQPASAPSSPATPPRILNERPRRRNMKTTPSADEIVSELRRLGEPRRVAALRRLIAAADDERTYVHQAARWDWGKSANETLTYAHLYWLRSPHGSTATAAPAPGSPET